MTKWVDRLLYACVLLLVVVWLSGCCSSPRKPAAWEQRKGTPTFKEMVW